MLKKVCIAVFLFMPLLSLAQVKNKNFKQAIDSMYKHTAPLIAVDSLKHLKNIYFLDAREEEEFEVSHIKNARNVGFIWFDMRKVYDIPKDAKVVVYCSVGYRSEKIAEKLIRDGYHHVYNLYGGIFEWINEGNPIYKTSGVQTTEIHTYTKNWGKWVEKGTKVY